MSGTDALHLTGQFVTGDSRSQVRISRILFQVSAVKTFQQIDRGFVVGGRITRWPAQIRGRILRIEIGSLKGCGQKAVAEVVLSGSSETARIVDGHKGWKIAAFRA